MALRFPFLFGLSVFRALLLEPAPFCKLLLGFCCANRSATFFSDPRSVLASLSSLLSTISLSFWPRTVLFNSIRLRKVSDYFFLSGMKWSREFARQGALLQPPTYIPRKFFIFYALISSEAYSVIEIGWHTGPFGFPPRNLCFLVTLLVFLLAKTDKVFCKSSLKS